MKRQMQPPSRSREPGAGLSNTEVVTLALFLLNGESRYIDTEDIAVKANELAPGRFTWKKYPTQINLELVRVYLSDAKKPDKGGYLLGSGNQGWLLTERGLKFGKTHIGNLEGMDLSRDPLSVRDQQLRQHERVRILASDAYARFARGDCDQLTRKEAEAVFRVDDYIVGKARERKIVRLANMFDNDHNLKTVLRAAADKLREEI